MTRVRNGNVSFEPPEGWTDGTVITLHAPSAAGPLSGPSIWVSHEPLRPGDTLRSHADRKLLQFGRGAPGFEIVSFEEATERTVAGRRAIQLKFVLAGKPSAIAETVVLVDSIKDPDAPDAGVAVIVSRAPVDRAPELAPIFERLLESVAAGPAGHALAGEGTAAHAGDAVRPVHAMPMPGPRR
jgi:hypothetical protein